MNVRHMAAVALAAVALSSIAVVVPAAARGSKMTNPDFTKGDKIPKDAKHDITLGATGLRGWM